jgi:hypothetical protein
MAMVLAIGALHFGALAHCPKPELDRLNLSDFYPLSVFRLRWPKPYQLGLAAVYLGVFSWLWSRLARAPLGRIFLAGLLFAILSNGLHGVRFGLDFPTATSGDGGIEYYHDALVIRGPLWLLQHFNAVQFELLEHSRTHPPGPVLLYWVLARLLRSPVLISIAITAIGLAFALPALKRLLVLIFGAEPPGALALFTILPAWLVYGLAVVDAPIAGIFLACVACFVDRERSLSWLASALLLFLALFFTFGALFLLPVLVGFELVRERSLRRSLKVLGVAALLIASLKPLFGFDWLAAFTLAARMENPGGFLLFTEPKRYLWYRLGAIAEVALFFTPFLCWLWARGWSLLRRQSADGWALAWLGPASLLAMLLSGAFKIGEVARIALFILPYLLLPVVAAFRELDGTGRARVAHAVVVYGAAFQLFGFYQW